MHSVIDPITMRCPSPLLARGACASLMLVAALALTPQANAQQTPPASDDAPPPEPPPAGTPLDPWDDPGTEMGRKRTVEETPDGLPAGGAKPYTPNLRPDQRRDRTVSIDQQQRALAEAMRREQAFNYGNKFVLGVAASYRRLPATLELGSVDGDPPPAASSGPGLNARLGFTPGSAVSVQGEVVYQPTQFAGIDGDGALLGARLALHLYLPLGKVRPFATVMGGIESLVSDVGPVAADIDWAVGGGVGVQYEFSTWVGVRADARLIGSDGRRAMATIFETSLGLELRFMPAP